ncbi:MAG: Ig-like domain-containing protein [Acidobacteria bacterium]|nr:Ig-like domain-containing protein [Acidobacteriota bacterium]
MRLILCFSVALAAWAQDVSLSLVAPRATLDVGRAMTVKASFGASIEVAAKVEFSSSNEGIALINAEGEVRGLFPGVTTIRAQEMTTGVTAELELKVIPWRIALTPPSLDLRLGDSVKLAAQALDADGGPITGVAFRYLSSQPQVLAISADGQVRALAEGAVTVTAQIDTAPVGFAFQSSVGARIGPRREYTLRRMLVSDPGSGAAVISGLTNLSASGETLGWVATLSNGGQAAVVRDRSGVLRVPAYSGQYLSNIGRLATRVTGVSVNSRGDAVASVQYPDPWCVYGYVLFPLNGPESELGAPVSCNAYLSRHSLGDDGSVYFFDTRAVQFIKRLPDGTQLTLLSRQNNGLDWIWDYSALRSGAAALVRAPINNGVPVTFYVTEKSVKRIFTAGDSIGGRVINGIDEWHGSPDGSFYARCSGQDFSAICRATADGVQLLLVSGGSSANGIRLGWVHQVFDAGRNQVLFSGDWNVADKYTSNLGLLEGSTLTRISELKTWNGVAEAQILASGAIAARYADSDTLLHTVRPGSEPAVLMTAQTALPVRTPAYVDLYYSSGSSGSSLLALGPGEQLVSLDAGGVRELVSPMTPLPDGGRMTRIGSLATNRNGQAVLTMNSYAAFGPFERLVFIANGATQAKTIFTYRQPLPIGVALQNVYNVAVDDLGRVMFAADILNGPRGLFFWDGQQVRELLRAGGQLDSRVVDEFITAVAGPKSFAVLARSQGTSRLYSFNGQNLKLELSGDQPVQGFSRTWWDLSSLLAMSGNSDLQLFAGASDGAGIVTLRPNGSTASILRAGDTLPEGGFVIQPIGLFSGPNGEVFISVHILEGGREKAAVYLATPLR